MTYTDYIARRAVQIAPVLFGLSALIFTISRILPGKPVRLALGPLASEKQVQRLRQAMGLNQPIHEQYLNWLVGVAHGQWGMSLRTGNNVLYDILVRLPATVELVMVALLFALVLAIPFGVIAGTNKDRWPDHISRILALSGVSMPRFWVAILLQILFVAILGIFPLQGRLSPHVTPPPTITGLYLVDSVITGQWHVFFDALEHIILPAFALGLSTLAQVMRLIRSDLIEEQRKDYVLAAQGYGLPQNLIKLKYMLKNAFTSSLTIIGLEVGFLLGNAFLVGIVFSWPGIATYGVQAILFQDFNAIIGVTIVVGAAFLLANLAVDVLYGYLDPRVRMVSNS